MNPVQSIDAELLRKMPLPWPSPHTDKDSRGKVLIAGGSPMSAGAVALSGLAALRAGAGKVMLVVPQPLSLPIAVNFPEAGVEGFRVSAKGHPSARAACEQIGTLLARADAFLLGPGLADEASAQKLALMLLKSSVGVTFVIDAMCITGLWDQRRVVSRRGGKLIITPHPGEMAALTGLSKEHINAEPIRVAEQVAGHLQCIVVLKGSATVIAQPDGPTYLYEGGGVGLATSGSGDVLAGALTGLVARGAKPVEAAVWSVYLHGEAGRRLAHRIGPLGFLARELPAEIPGLMEELAASRAESSR
jgi:ADP-dependent NAD(P)H-hydrate dehydratase